MKQGKFRTVTQSSAHLFLTIADMFYAIHLNFDVALVAISNWDYRRTL